MAEDAILGFLSGNERIEDSQQFAESTGVDHTELENVIKSLHGFQIVVAHDLKRERWALTDEGKSYAREGSPEARLHAAVPPEGAPRAQLQKAMGDALFKIASSQAVKNKWVEIGKQLVTRKVESVEDRVKCLLNRIELGEVVDAADINDLKKRKLIVLQVSKGYSLTKGPKYTTKRVKAATDLTREHLQRGDWKDLEFKEYNLTAKAPPIETGCFHPLLKVRQQMKAIFLELGFVEMPTNKFVESSFWNFDALFQPQQHPARDSHDTFFLKSPSTTRQLPEDYVERVKRVHESGGYGSRGYRYNWKREEAEKNLLRTHTTAVSSRMLYLLAQKPFSPIRYFSIDRVFRNEAVDRTHLAEFHQIEGVVCDRGLTLGDLIGVLSDFFERLGMKKLRFKPAYNPYTEPSMEIFSYHDGFKKWVEVGNSGMFRPEMLRPMGLPEDVSVNTVTPYASSMVVEWSYILDGIERLDARNNPLSVGLLNFDSGDIDYWRKLMPDGDFSVVHLKPADESITWGTLYPEWIDEEEEFEVPKCPNLPSPRVSRRSNFDLIAVKLPCEKSGEWSRNVARLHLQLSAAKLAASSGEVRGPAHVLFVTECFPIPNLFRCKDLIFRKGSVWVYRPDRIVLREKMQLPVGSCELAIPLKTTARFYSEAPHREAYATILHSAHVYVCGAIAAAQSIRMAGSNRDLVILVDETISEHHRGGLEAAGWKVRTIQRIRNPKAERDAYNEWNYSKFRLWQLTDYDKIIFIDADLLILRNIDFLFAMPEITATGNNATLFNSGVMVVEPSNCTFQLLMDHINEIESYNGGDQGYLNEIFTWWHRIPKHMNFLKHFWVGDEEEKKLKKIQLFAAEPPVLYVLHYLGMKPWLCFRDYDCNWNVDILHEFASDVAHGRWWKVHDAMPENLHHFCLLRSKQKAALEWDRRQAEKANYPDGHWNRTIQDKRLTTCFEEFCFWESMLWHWGETNWTDSSSSSPSSPISALNGSSSL